MLLFLSARLVDKPFCVEVAVVRVTEDAAREVVGAGGGPFPRRRSGPGMIVNSIAIGCSPEEILLERERKPVHRAHGGSRLFNVSLGDG